MSKRKAVHFASDSGGDDDIEGAIKRRVVDTGEKSAHSMDSDEELEEGDAQTTYDILREEDIQGEEEGIYRTDGDINITPFNLKDEMEEGHFDASGTFIFNNEEEEIKDNWLDNVDWVRLSDKRTDGTDLDSRTGGTGAGSDSDSEDIDHAFSVNRTLKDILELLKPGETVAKALRRLGGSHGNRVARKPFRRNQRPTKETEGALASNDATPCGRQTDLLNRLTGLADSLIQRGHYELYQHTYELIKHKLTGSQPEPKRSESVDMFGDNDVTGKSGGDVTGRSGGGDDTGRSGRSGDVTDRIVDVLVGVPKSPIQWDYKSDSGEFQGPFTSDRMEELVREGKLGSGWVRRVDRSDGPFYNINRVDFSIYL